MFSSLALLALVPAAMAQYGGGAAPAGSSTSSTSSSTSTATSSSSSSTHSVIVGQDGGFTFTPNSFTAAAGSVVEFQFQGLNHSVAESTFASPCAPANSSSFFAGFNFAAAVNVFSTSSFTLQVNNTEPIWFFCPQVVGTVSHCADEGMVGVINPPAGKTVSDFMTAAKAANGTIMPTTVQGGVENANSTSTTGSTTSSTTSSAATTSSSGAASHVTVGMGLMGVVGVLFSALIV